VNETDRHNSTRSDQKRIRLVLRDHSVLEARAHVASGQFLIPYLSGRKRYISLTGAVWLATDEPVDYMVLKVDRILWVSSPDSSIPLMNVMGTSATRQVEISLEGGLVLHANMSLGQRQRLSDYLASAPDFIPLIDAAVSPRNSPLGDIALNQDAVRSIREVRDARPGAMPPAPPAAEPADAEDVQTGPPLA